VECNGFEHGIAFKMHSDVMQLVSVNVGPPKWVQFDGRKFLTGICKAPVSGTVSVNLTQVQGDGQADLEAHGGVDKAVYLYAVEHYDFWRKELDEEIEALGSFGENFTARGMLENKICIGDTFKIGTAIVQVTQPRTPCYKLAARFMRKDLPARFLQSLKSGFYLRVLQAGQVTAEDRFILCDQDPNPVTVCEVSRIYHFQRDDQIAVENILKNRALSAEWRAVLQKQLNL
jgi:MOSC domain-containing protein YiiM